MVETSTIDRDRLPITITIGLFVALSLAASITSEGFLEADGCTHYLYAKYAFAEPHYLLNIWGRPICTALYALPAWVGGLFGVRCASLVIAVALSLVAYAIARWLGLRRPSLALVFTLAQPLVFLHSFSELTELPFALLLGLAFLAYQDRRWIALALLTSLLPLARPEGCGFVPLVAIALIAHRRAWHLLILPIPLIAWSYLGWRADGSNSARAWYTWLIDNWPYAQVSAYRSGSIAHFVLLLPAVVSPLAMPALLLGVATIIRARASALQSHHRRCALLVVLIPLMILAGHSVLFATGRMASSGEARYLLIVAPFWAVLVARGWEWFFQWRGWMRIEMKAAALVALVPILCNRAYRVVPILETDDWLRAKLAARWVESTPLRLRYPLIQTAHPGVYYFLDLSQTDKRRSVEWSLDTLAAPRAGVMLIWDHVYSTHNADRNRIADVDVLLRAGWIPIDVPAVQDGWTARDSTWRMFVSPTDVDDASTAHPQVRQ